MDTPFGYASVLQLKHLVIDMNNRKQKASVQEQY